MVKIKFDLVKIEHNLEEEIINAEYQQKIKLENNTINTRNTAVPIPNARYVEKTDQNEVLAIENSYV